MTNKKLKMAAMSVALTACVAASPLAAKADAPEAAPEKKEPVAEETETKKEENTAEPQVNQEAKNAQETLKDAEVKYNKDNPTTNPDGSQKLDGVIVTNPEGSGETGSETGGETNPNPNPNPDSSETKPGGETGSGETGSGETGSGETGGTTDPEQKKPEEVVIGTAEKTEKSETNVETKPNPGAEPIVDTTTPPTVEKNPDGSTTITQTTVTPGKETTTTTGTGEAKGNLHEKEEEVPKKDIDLTKELGEKPDISWNIEKGADAVNGYKVEDVTNSEDGNQQTLKLRKEEETTAEMTAEDIAKLVDAEKPTVNPDGTYTLTRTETILDAEGNPQTRTTYITIRDNKVTTKTTTELTITREKEKQEGNERVDFEVKYPEIIVTNTNKEKPEEKQTISRELLDTILSQNPKEDGSYEYTDKDGQKYEVKVDGTAEKLNNEEIVARLQKDGHTEYTLGADGEIYYTTPHNETVKLDVTQNELLRQSLTYTVTLTTTKKGETETAGEQIATEKARRDATRDALTKAVDALGVDTATASQLKAKISDLKFTQEQLDNGDTFKVKLDDGKTYTLTYSAAGATVTASTPTTDKSDTGKKPEDITDVYDNTVTGTAYVTGSKITYQHGAEYKTTGMDTLGIGADFTTAPGAVPGSIQTDTAGRITSYKDAAGNTHSFTYESVDLSKLTEAERAALEKAAKQEGWKTENLTASLTRVSWKVESPRIETPQTTPIEDGKTVNLVNDNNWSQTDHGDTVDFTHDNTTYTGMTLENESGNVKTYKKTEANGTVTIITVTTRQLDIKAQFDKKFGEGKYEMNAAEHTVTYTGEDGKTYKAKYQDKVEELAVEVQKPDVVAATGSTDAEAEAAFRKKLEKALKDAEDAGETLVIEYTKDGKIETLTVTKETKWEEISKLVGHVVNYNAMTDAELTTYLKELEKTAQEDGKYYTGSTEWSTPYYWDATDKMMKRVPPENVNNIKWDLWRIGYYVEINGKEYEVHHNRNYIDHLDLATDSHLTLSEKAEDGKAKTDDCVLLNPTLKWSEKAETLVNGGGTQANFVDRITYDHENDNNPSTGHYEYPRASWDKKTSAKDDNAPTKSVFYKVEGKVAYGKVGDAYEATPTGRKGSYTNEDYAAARKRAEAALAQYKEAYPDAQVVEICEDQKERGKRYYQIYLYQSDLTAYGYMSDDNNTCGNALFEPGSKSMLSYIGGYDLTLGNLTQTDEKHVVAMGKNTIALSATFKRRKLEERLNKALNYTPISVTETIIHESEVTGQGTDLSGSYQANYTKTEDYRDEQQQGGIAGTGTGSYKSFTNLIRNIFKGDGKGTVEGGFIKYEYHTEKNKDGTPVPFEADKMVVTTKQDAEVHYTFTSQESRDVWIKGYTQTVVPPVNPGPDSPELPPVEDAKPAPAPAPAPETPVLPVVQDARPDPAPTPAPTPAPAPETPVLPAVQDAKLIQTGTSGWLADLMLGAGMVLSAAGYWMERKRKAMFYKSQH
ncbi:hypothetical protein AAAT28_10460 [Faecalibacterium duncaniae]|uniref:hypothetical protein n=1 Tax=Faecalibacterium duncaniae (strain DSM 17677 / JCM 31915 / A2-165) TaxID=411483 RepID=UPI0032BF38B4